jgi:hypothetical protein
LPEGRRWAADAPGCPDQSQPSSPWNRTGGAHPVRCSKASRWRALAGAG